LASRGVRKKGGKKKGLMGGARTKWDKSTDVTDHRDAAREKGKKKGSKTILERSAAIWGKKGGRIGGAIGGVKGVVSRGRRSLARAAHET